MAEGWKALSPDRLGPSLRVTLAQAGRLRLPAFTTQALADLRDREDRNTGPVFATRDGNELDAANIRREFTAAIHAADVDGAWSRVSSATPSSASCPTPVSPSRKSPASRQTPNARKAHDSSRLYEALSIDIASSPRGSQYRDR
jgi:hypothetical protein